MAPGRNKILAAIILLVISIFAFDQMLPDDVSASVLYVVPIILAIGLGSRRTLALVVVACLFGTIISDLLGVAFRSKPLDWPNELISLLAQLTTASLVWMQMRSNEREHALRERAEAERLRLMLVHSVATTTSSELDLPHVLETVGTNLASMFVVETAAIWLADESGQKLWPAYYNTDAYKTVAQAHKTVDWESSPLALAEAIRRRRLLVVGEGYGSPPESLEVLRMIDAKMSVIAPMFVRDQLVGAIVLAMNRVRRFGQGDKALLETIGKQVAIAIESARLFDNINRQSERLSLINEMGQVFASTLDLGSIYLSMRDKLSEIIDCDTLLISLYDSTTETIRCGFAYTDGEVILPGRFEPLKLGAGPQSQCIRSAQPLIVDNIAKRHPGKYRYIGNSPNYPISILYVPMIAEQRVIGVIQAQSVREGAYTEEDVPLLSILANQAASAIENARLYNEAVEGRRAMERANQIKDEFLAILSHELRTPLTPILGWTRILAKLPPEDHETRAQAISVIDRNARFQSQLVNDLLDMSRIESGKLSIHLEPVDLNAAVRATVENLRSEAELSKISIETRFDREIIMVSADPARVAQIIGNLITNAIKFTDGKGRIIISAERSGDFGLVKVSDTGIGIPSDFLPHIFDRFRQADSSIRRRHGGLGLGLSIVKSLVEMHGGQITVESEGPNRGATFSVQLPLAASQIKPSNSGQLRRQAAAENESLAGLSLLIVEDDPDTLEMMRVLFESHTARVVEAKTAEEALALAAVEQLDLIISDITLPGMGGTELASYVRDDDRLKDLPMIALTGLVSDKDRERALAAGFDAHLSKPIDYDKLIILVKELAKSRVVTSNQN